MAFISCLVGRESAVSPTFHGRGEAVGTRFPVFLLALCLVVVARFEYTKWPVLSLFLELSVTVSLRQIQHHLSRNLLVFFPSIFNSIAVLSRVSFKRVSSTFLSLSYGRYQGSFSSDNFQHFFVCYMFRPAEFLHSSPFHISKAWQSTCLTVNSKC